MEFAMAERRLVESLVRIGRTPRVIYDIGASNGWWSAIVGHGMPDTIHHLFEPQPDHAEYREHLAQHLRNPNWHLHPIALSSTNGTSEFYVQNSDPTGSTILAMKGNAAFNRMTVSQIRLDDYVAEKRLALPSVVKIDTQGSERLIIEGGRSTIAAADALMVETWLYRSYGPSTPLIGEIIDIGTELGFVVHDYGSVYRDAEGKMHSIDLFFAKPEIAKALCTP